jgi:hypothetical protein
MIAIVLNKEFKQIDKLEGKIFRGTFVYKTGGFLGFGGQEERLPIEYDKCIPVYHPGFLILPGRSELTAYFKYDGKNLTQISFTDINIKSNIVDYNSLWKQGEYAKASVLKVPSDNTTELIKWLGIIVVVILMVGSILIVNSDYNNLKTSRAQDSAQLRNISERQLQTQIVISNVIARDTGAYNRSIALYSRLLNQSPGKLG